MQATAADQLESSESISQHFIRPDASGVIKSS